MTKTVWSKRDEHDCNLEMRVSIHQNEDGELTLECVMYGVNYFNQIGSEFKLTPEDRQELIDALQGSKGLY